MVASHREKLQEKAQELRDNLILSDVVQQFSPTALKRRGKEFVGLCPFHEEKTPSFTVNDAKGLYYCFGCGAGGDAIKFVRETQGKNFAEAVRLLSGDSLTEYSPRHAEKKPALKAEPKKNKLSIEQRHHSHRKLIKNFGLASWRRNHLIEKRGLTPEQVNWCYQQGFIFDWEPGVAVTGISPQLAGINPNNGQLVGEPGMAIAAFNPTRQATGYQIKPDNPKKGAKYIWASSSWLGNSIHLPNGDAPLFAWKHPEATKITEVWLCEGALKSLLLALKAWSEGNTSVVVVGTASSARYPQLTFRQYLTELNPKIVRLFPDAGIGSNEGIQKANLQTISQVEELGFEIEIAWWGQFSKDDGDIDELADWNRITYLCPAEFKCELGTDIDAENIAYKNPHSNRNPKKPTSSGVGNLRASLRSMSAPIESEVPISKQEWDKQFGLPRQEKETESFLLNQVKKVFRIGKKRKEKAQARHQQKFDSITNTESPNTSTENIIQYSPNSIPDLIEWCKQGEPVIRFSSGEQVKPILRESKEKGFKHILDRSYTGSGKSYNYGNLTLSDLGLKETAENEEEKKNLPRFTLISESPRNPTTATVENNYTVPEVKHGGLVEDKTRQTPLGRNHWKRSTKIEHDAVSKQELKRRLHSALTPSIVEELIETPSCIHWATFQAATERGYHLRADKKSPVCTTCNRFEYCSIINSAPEEARYLSYHPEALKTPRMGDIAFYDEARNLLKDTKTFTAHRRDIERASIHIERKAREAGDERTPKLVNAFIHSLLDGLDEFTPENRKYGADHRESVEQIIFKPLIGESVEVLAAVSCGTKDAYAIEDYWADPVDEGVPVRWFKPSVVPTVQDNFKLNGETVWADSFKLRNIQSRIAFDDKIWESYSSDWLNLEDSIEESFYLDPIYSQEVAVTISTNVWGMAKRFTTTNKQGKVGTNRKIQYSPVVPSINDLKSQLNHYLHSRDEQLFTAQQNPTQKYESVTTNVLYNWLNPCLDILSGDSRTNLRANGETLFVTRPSYRQSNLAKQFSLSVYLDATVDKHDLAQQLKLEDVDHQLSRLNEELNLTEQFHQTFKHSLNQLDNLAVYLAAGNTLPMLRQVMIAAALTQKDINRMTAIQTEVSGTMRELIRQNKILKIEQARPSYSNLTFHIYSNLGKVTRDRFCRDKKTGKFNTDSRYALGNRVQTLTTHLIDEDLATGKQVGLLESKAMIQGTKLGDVEFSPYLQYKDNTNIKMGWFFNDHVGSNRFENVDSLLVVGKPQINLGQQAAIWQTRTGLAVAPSHPTGEFAAWIERVMLGELEQTVGRPRPHRRPDDDINIHLIDEYSSSEIAYLKAKFPGATFEFHACEDVCLEAATKGTQLTARFDAIIKNLIQLGDIAKTTAAQVGESLGVTHGRISQLCKERWGMGFREFKRLLISLLGIDNRKINETELSEEEKWIANHYLPYLVEDWQDGEVSEPEMIDGLVTVAKSFGEKAFRRIIQASPPLIVAQLIKSLFVQFGVDRRFVQPGAICS